MRIIPLCLAASLAGCTPDPSDSGDSAPPQDPEPRQIAEHSGDTAVVADGVEAFALALHQQLATGEDNLVTSPISVAAALSMSYAGARGATAEEMATVLNIGLEDATHHQAFGALLRDLGGEHHRPYTLHIANRPWGQTGYPWEQPFLDILEQDYDAPMGEVDFMADPSGAEQAINDWVADQTDGVIPALLPPGSITNETRLALANAIYFYAEWVLPFAAEMTRSGSFTKHDGSEVEATFMYRYDEDWWWAEDEDCSVIQLPYVGQEVSAYIVLPTEHDGLPALEAAITAERWNGWMNQIEGREHHADGLGIPRFSVSSWRDLVPQLAAMGMPSAFDGATADFSGIAGDAEPSLHISHVIHQAYISVDEAGTEAGGATVVISENGDPVVIYVKHPFLLVIRDDLTHTPLFVARVMEPEG